MKPVIVIISLLLASLLPAQTVSLVKESKFFDTFKIEEANVLIKLPKNWSLGSEAYSKKQSNENELKKIISERYVNGQGRGPLDKFAMTLGPYVSEGKIILSTHMPTERINSELTPHYYYDFAVGMVNIKYLETKQSASTLAEESYTKEVKNMQSSQDTISPKVIGTKINGIDTYIFSTNKSLFPKSTAFTFKQKYFLQLDNGVLVIDSGTYESSVEKVTTEQGKIINRISKG